MTPGVSVREARAGDEPALVAVDAAAWTSRSGFPSVSDPRATTFFTESAGPADHLVAVHGGVVVGYVRLGSPTPLPESRHVMSINGLAVAPGARGLGAGRALLEAAERRAREQGRRKLSLRVFGGNAPARRLYERAGFRVEGVLVGEFLIERQPEDDVVMAKHLTG